MSKIAMVIGATGQSPSYLCEELLSKNYKVIGTRRRTSSSNLWRLENCIKNSEFELVYGDVTDSANIYNLLLKYKPDLVFNASAMSHVAISFEQPILTWKINSEGHLNILEAFRQIIPKSKLIFFASSEMFGNNKNYHHGDSEYFLNPKNGYFYQNENTRFSPVSPYGLSKYAAFNATKIYRESYNLRCFSGIMFNKESNRRGINFVTRKITSYFYNLKKYGFVKKLKLGNLESYRDWSYSKEIMNGLVKLSESDLNNDYIFASGETHSIKDFLNEVANLHNLEWKNFVEIDKNLFRPNELNYLRGDASNIKRDLNWESKTKFHELVELMVSQENGLE